VLHVQVADLGGGLPGAAGTDSTRAGGSIDGGWMKALVIVNFFTPGALSRST
jgi:hypothetical protein